MNLPSDNDDKASDPASEKNDAARAAVIDLLDSDDDDENETQSHNVGKAQKKLHNPYRKKSSSNKTAATNADNKCRKRAKLKAPSPNAPQQSLQAGLVLEEDVDATTCKPASSDDDEAIIASYAQQQAVRTTRGELAQLFHDPDFEPIPSSIEGSNKKAVVTCRCRGSQPAKLSYKTRNGNGNDDSQRQQHPYYHCATNKCNYFQWAFQAEKLQWYRFGTHTGHCIVSPTGFSANDLSQGRVGDCWFLSALAVVAERPDLIGRLFGNGKLTAMDDNGIVQVNLFLDGYWKTVVLDNFLPCIVDNASEAELQQTLEASLGFAGSSVGRALKNGVATTTASNAVSQTSSSNYDPHAVADKCREVLQSTSQFLEQHQARSTGILRNNNNAIRTLQRRVTSQDLAYSKASKNQLWAPFLEKAYAKSHGCYKAISGGHIAEAFLDLTGAPTVVYNFDSKDFQPRSFWSKLLQYRRQRLPLGCATSSSAAGIIGMHAYSILDVREVNNVSFQFFQETGVAHGNVSGFTEYDGTVRLLRIRNPHGKGEWKGDFSDKSEIWEKLLQHQEGPVGSSPGLHRTMRNDGIFWIDYDSFLMGFSNVDVVLAFLGNHAKSFPSNFAAKKSNHRCVRAFEVSLLDPQPGVPNRDTVELYIMGIQRTRRGATRGRSDRKKSYKVCDLGMLVGENNEAKGGVVDDENNCGEMRFTTVKGQMFGFRRNGHLRLILDRKKKKSLVVMPISFGHPAATDKELPFVLRFVSDAPLLITELPNVPRMDAVLQTFCLSRHSPGTKQGIQRVVLDDPMYRLVQVDCLGNEGGTVFLYLCINQDELHKQGLVETGISFSVQANCRGMSCRTENGLPQHETIAKGKKFEAAWRRYTCDFIGEKKSRLLLVLFQSGQDTEFGSIVSKRIATPSKLGSKQTRTLDGFLQLDPELTSGKYIERGIFNCVDGKNAFELSGSLRGNFAAIDHLGGYQEGVDDELERALALSRGDLELQHAQELSRQGASGRHDSAHFDVDLRRALELSMVDAADGSVECVASTESGNSKPVEQDPARMMTENPAGVVSTMSYEEELAKVIQLSMKESRQSTQSKGGVDEIVDLTEETVPSKRRKMNDDTADNTNESDEGKKQEKHVDLAEKQRLAAEAAMKRFSRIDDFP